MVFVEILKRRAQDSSGRRQVVMSFTRVRALCTLGLVLVAAVVVVVVALVRDSQADAATGNGCPQGTTMVNLDLPAQASEVKLRVFNGTRTPGLADRVSKDFKDRGFQVQPPGKGKYKSAATAIVRFGPKTVGAAQWIRAHFLGEAEPQFAATQTTDVIDIIVGDQYRQLATRTEVNQSMAQLGSPDLPPGTCAAPTETISTSVSGSGR
ncbi:LytR C-terminal domain-containing protein [Actinoplanes regularis]|uniref:LytR C-terminal domain-containing protein n=1 Tax=Actinoplanes regularis TaxID=52697 RepID=UPI001A3ADBC9|nr:LytR C-terminal domain-containing protein [Actinoplanes regularis]GIE85807.1 hypothetical protein Are01nite_22870 [Actinoplanes regularis]